MKKFFMLLSVLSALILLPQQAAAIHLQYGFGGVLTHMGGMERYTDDARIGGFMGIDSNASLIGSTTEPDGSKASFYKPQLVYGHIDRQKIPTDIGYTEMRDEFTLFNPLMELRKNTADALYVGSPAMDEIILRGSFIGYNYDQDFTSSKQEFTLEMKFQYPYCTLDENGTIALPWGEKWSREGPELIHASGHIGSDSEPFTWYNISSGSFRTVPEPTTMLLFGAGLVGLAGFGRKRFKK